MATQNIYKKVLEIGSECIECGISFNDLKKRLKNEGFDIDNECLNRCLREWFFNSFFHEETVCDKGSSSIKELDNHLDCNFILKAETCLRILSYEEAEKSNELVSQLNQQTELYQSQVELLQSQLTLAQSSITESKKESKSARNFAIWALIASAFFGLPDALTYFNIKPSEDISEVQMLQKGQLNLLEQQKATQDSIKSLKSLISKNTSISQQKIKDSTNKVKSKAP